MTSPSPLQRLADAIAAFIATDRDRQTAALSPAKRRAGGDTRHAPRPAAVEVAR